jgi:hypothetical protein
VHLEDLQEFLGLAPVVEVLPPQQEMSALVVVELRPEVPVLPETPVAAVAVVVVGHQQVLAVLLPHCLFGDLRVFLVALTLLLPVVAVVVGY